MERIQIRLAKQHLDALRKAAARSGLGVAEIVPRAIRKLVLETPGRGPVALWDGKARRTSVEHDAIHDDASKP